MSAFNTANPRDARMNAVAEKNVQRVVTESATLNPGENVVKVILLKTGTLTVTLPATGTARGQKFFVYVVRPTDYTDGTCTVTGPADGISTAIARTSLATNYDYVEFDNLGGMDYREGRRRIAGTNA